MANVQLAKAVNIREYLGGSQLRALDKMAYSGCFDSQTLDDIAAAVLSRRCSGKALVYYAASLYLQLGEADKARDLLRGTGRASREMKWFSMLMLYCRGTGLACPRLSRGGSQCLDYLQEKYSGSVGVSQTLPDTALLSRLADLVNVKSGFSVIGNAPAADVDDRISLREDHLSICFNNYHLNARIEGDADVHVVTPSWRSAQQVPGRHLIITGNSIFYRRSKVWRRFEDRPSYVGIHTVPRNLWCSLVEQLGASPSAGLLLLSCLEKYIDVTGKDGLVAGFSERVPTQNHSYDREPISPAHNWPAEVKLRQTLLQRIEKNTRSLHVSH